MTRPFVALALAAFSGVTFAAPAHFTPGYAACLTQKLFDQFVTALARQDADAIAALALNGCIATERLAPYPAAVTGTPKPGVIQARVYLPKGSMEFYAPAESLPARD